MNLECGIFELEAGSNLGLYELEFVAISIFLTRTSPSISGCSVRSKLTYNINPHSQVGILGLTFYSLDVQNLIWEYNPLVKVFFDA